MTISFPIRLPDPLAGPDPTTITLRPLNAPFAVHLFMILEESHQWIVHDIRIAKRSQFAQPGALPGDLFGSTAIDLFVKLDVCPEGQPIELDVSYVGEGDGLFKAMLEGRVPCKDDDLGRGYPTEPDLRMRVEVPGHEAVIIGGPHGDGL